MSNETIQIQASIPEKIINFYKKLNIPFMLFGVIILMVFFGFTTDWLNFSARNLQLIIRNSSILLIASIGMTMMMLVSQVDLSIGSVMAMSASITAVAMVSGMHVVPALLLGILSGIVTGLVNAFLVVICKFDYWIVTFATMGVAMGLALVITDANVIPIRSPVFFWLGSGRSLGVYNMVWITIFLVIFMDFVLRRTKFGHDIYSIGGSEVTARLSGVNVVKNRIIVYVCSGFFSSIAGLFIAATQEAVFPAANNYSFDAIAAVIIGGTSFDGGRGGIYGTVLGAVTLRVLANGLALMGIAATWQRTIIGIVIVMVLVMDAINQKYRKTHELRRVYTDD